MTFARVVFLIAGIWGFAVLTPLYWLRDATGRAYTVPTESPQFFYGFFAVALTWQLAVLAIAWNPIRPDLADLDFIVWNYATIFSTK